MTTPSTGPSLVVGFGRVFYAEAGDCAKRAAIAGAHSDANRTAGAVAATVLMSCAALEASLSELATCLACPSPQFTILAPDVLAFVRDGNSPLYTRFAKLISFYSPETQCDDHEPFKNIRCLVELRNHFAHRHAAFLHPDEWPTDLRQCRKRIPYHSDGKHDWTSVLLVPPVADWAVGTLAAFFAWATPFLPTVRAGSAPNAAA